ncbi:MAG: Na/Pi symporter, partial [Oscillospiraceae bacterium]
MTNNLFKSLLLGLIVTAAIQSSSATTVIVVGLVNAGILKLKNAIGVIMGANIGTTVTSVILSLGDLDKKAGTGAVLKLFKPTTLAPIIAIIGIIILMTAKKNKRKIVGEIMLGFGVLFNGMFIMTDAVAPLSNSPVFRQLFATLSNPLLGILAGVLVTAVIQSSSASVGILQAIASSGAITYSAAFPIIMGQN